MKKMLLAGLVALTAVAARAGDETAAPAARVLELTGGAEVRIVFARARQVPEDAVYHIMAWDTAADAPRILLADTHSQHPMLTPRGDRVVFDDWTFADAGAASHPTRKVHVVDWSGKNLRDVCAASQAVGLCEDPPGTEWVMVLDDDAVLWRVQLDNPAMRQVMWDKKVWTGILSPYGWSFSRDGSRACVTLPWPDVCLVTLPNGTCRHVGQGCRPGITGDGQRFFHCTHFHNSLTMCDSPGDPGHFVPLGNAPGVGQQQLGSVSWVHDDPRFFTVRGPWPVPGNVLFGQFDSAFTAVRAWVQITRSPTSDVWSDAWIAPPQPSSAAPPPGPGSSPGGPGAARWLRVALLCTLGIAMGCLVARATRRLKTPGLPRT